MVVAQWCVFTCNNKNSLSLLTVLNLFTCQLCISYSSSLSQTRIEGMMSVLEVTNERYLAQFISDSLLAFTRIISPEENICL